MAAGSGQPGGVVKRVMPVVAGLLLAAGVAAVIVLTKPSLDRTEKWFSIAGVVISTALALAATRLAGRGRRDDGPDEAPTAAGDPPPPAAGGQTVTGSAVGGGIVQIRGVRGNVRLGPSAAASSGPRPRSPWKTPAKPSDEVHDGQRVDGTTTGGPVHQVDGVVGDVESG